MNYDSAGNDHADRISPFWQRKPYDVPDSLDNLRGPVGGLMHLPIAIYWAKPGGSTVDLSTPVGRSIAYGEAMEEGTLKHICSIINKDHLVREWKSIPKSYRVAALWEMRFPELDRTLPDELMDYFGRPPYPRWTE